MYFVNWQRAISLEERDGHRVVVKRNKPTTMVHEYLLFGTYVLISILLAHPSPSPTPGGIARNEGYEMRDTLGRLGIRTPRLLSISNDVLIEEYVEGGDLYRALASGRAGATLAFAAGSLTGLMHGGGYVFTDNKAQNFLVRGSNDVLRTDLGFIQKSSSAFARGMDVGSFLASVIDLPSYREIERAFYDGYKERAGKFPYLTLVIRNILAAGFAADSKTAIKNMMITDSFKLLGT